MATTIALRNKMLNEDEINYAVQKLIDRIIFLRICEDRGVEPYGELQRAAERGEVYQNLCQLFHTADEKYNSGLFNFREDRITPGLIIDNKVLKIIVKDLYYPKCEFEFSVMPADILGSVYERFLGKTIRLTPAHYAKIEDKPEVRKAGGVYYTPKYIVDYIVENTVGKLVENKSPAEASQLKICDPACGSGSFLIGAYQYLLDWHLKYYLAHPPAKKKDSPLTPDGRLTTAEKKRILLNNIYGVDIDSQAVEVTRLNLLLKAMEGETQASISQQLSMFHERVLPNLDKNVKCGNSLIGTDFYDGQTELFPEQLKKVNAFDWEEGFPEVFRQEGIPAEASAKAGFDAVIGNPPWGAEFSENELEYLRKKHQEIIVRMIDSFMYFVHLGSKILSENGCLGFILPDVILYQEDNWKLRQFLLKYSKLRIIINSGDVFEKVNRPSSILIFDMGSAKENSVIVADVSNFKKSEKSLVINDKDFFKSVYQDQLMNIPNVLFITSNPDYYSILLKLKELPFLKLEELVDEDGIQRGVSPDLKEAFIVDRAIIEEYYLERRKIKPVLTGGREVKRYNILSNNNFLIYTSRDDDFTKLPNICKFIDSFKGKITCKEVKQKKHPLYALHRPRKESIFLKPSKIVGVITADKIITALDEKQFYVTDGLYLFGVKEGIAVNYLIGILNSSLFVFVYRLLSMEKGRMLAQVKPTLLNELPIRIIDNHIPEEKQTHDRIIQLVDNVTKLNTELHIHQLDTSRQQIQRAIDHAEKRIDQLVYELYGLTEEEIKIIEEGG
ncbi:MAG: N-6 DNA methylase [Lentimicrobiaceae bacterium]|nr:N-6 DNA methylase [Lentimicrobiaceae bacterium]